VPVDLLVIGGSDAGIAAALRARELDPSAQVKVLVADRYPNFSICGLPYLVGGDVADWRDLAHRTLPELEATGMKLLLDHEATAIDAGERKVACRAPDGDELTLRYDRLVVGTGAEPIRPPLPGLDLNGVHVLHTMAHALDLQRVLDAGAPQSAVIVGAGYIGLEMAEALARRGLGVTVLEQAPEVLPTVDPKLGTLVREELDRHDVRVACETVVTGVAQTDGGLRVTAEGDRSWTAELVLISVGVRPDSALARDAGAALGVRGAVRVDRDQSTGLPDVWAAGDCAETYHRILGAPAYLPLGTTAHKQGRIAGENALGGRRLFEGSLGTQVVKVFDLVAARTGLREAEARDAGLEPLTVEITADDHKAYYPGARPLHVRLTGDRSDGRLLGLQLVGQRSGEVAKRIDTAAAALYAGLAVAELNDLDLSYTPPLGSPWDPLQVAAQEWQRRRT
jgi:NADPH-dependent 2,4-dienoyl-CoA reductase/sulfur reductase-like enzyme